MRTKIPSRCHQQPHNFCGGNRTRRRLSRRPLLLSAPPRTSGPPSPSWLPMMRRRIRRTRAKMASCVAAASVALVVVAGALFLARHHAASSLSLFPSMLQLRRIAVTYYHRHPVPSRPGISSSTTARTTTSSSPRFRRASGLVLWAMTSDDRKSLEEETFLQIDEEPTAAAPTCRHRNSTVASNPRRRSRLLSETSQDLSPTYLYSNGTDRRLPTSRWISSRIPPPYSNRVDPRRRQILVSWAGIVAATALPSTLWNQYPTSVLPAAAAEVIEATISLTDVAAAAAAMSTVITSPLDDREYAAYTLESNNLRILLVSDPTSLEGGAAMTVHVGATSDPDVIPGLAHFCEHMLFLGTEQYPKEDSFEAFLSSNGGSSNAYTDSERTVYYLDMEIESDNKFAEALLRFGSFFSAPLFTEAATGRELNAIDSEHAKNLQSDTFRYFQLTKARANLDHPFSKFFTGNKQTLLDNPVLVSGQRNLRQELLNFYESYYSSNVMTLAVVGPQPISVLKEMTDKAFAKIPNRAVVVPEAKWDGLVPPYVIAEGGGDGTDAARSTRSLIPAFRHVVEIVPVQDLRQVTLTWPLMYMSNVMLDQNASLLTKPSSYVGHLLGHEGPKSLLSYLKRKGWVNSIAAGTEDKLSDFETFEVVVGLTPRGLSSLDDVIAAIFTYIYMLRDRTLPPYVLDEVLLLDELQWRYQTKTAVSSYVQSLSTAMQKFPPELYVAGPRRLSLEGGVDPLDRDARLGFTSREALERTRDRVQNYVSSLTVDNVMVTVLSKTFEGQTDQKERWYGTDYRVRPIASSTIDKWRKGLKTSNLKIDFPRPNPFIPSESGLRLKFPPPPLAAKDAALLRTFESRMQPRTPPRIILDDDRWTVHFREDDTFGQPKGYLIIQILTQEAYSTPMRAALSNLYEICVSDRLREYAYDAELAGLTYDVKVLPRGVRLTFGGYNDKLQEFATYITKKLTVGIRDVLPAKDSDFDRYKDQVLRALSAFDAQQPYSHASYYAQLTLQPLQFQYPNSELRVATRKITLPDLVEYANGLFASGVKGEALVQGNFDADEALDLVKTVGNAVLPARNEPVSDDLIPPRLKALPLPSGDANTLPTRLLVAEPNPGNENACSYVVLQSLGESPRDHVLMELLGAVLAEPFYNELRTQKQLGYVVSSGVRAVGESRTLAFVVQSSVAEADTLTINILAFLEGCKEMILQKLSKGDVAVFVKSLIDRKTEPDKDLIGEVTRNWGEVSSGRLQFDRPQLEASALLYVTKDDLLEFWDALYVTNGRRVLICEMIPRIGDAQSALPPSSFGYKFLDLADPSITLGVDDIEMFRRDREQLVDTYIEM